MPVGMTAIASCAEQTTEKAGEQIVQIDKTIECQAEYAGDKLIQAAGNSVVKLCQTTPELHQTGMGRAGIILETELYGGTAALDRSFGKAGGEKAFQKALQHFIIGEGNSRVQSKLRGICPKPRRKGGKPPGAVCHLGVTGIFVAQHEGKGKNIRVGHGTKTCPQIFIIFQYPVGIIQTDFGTGIDTVLSFPKFQKPGASGIVKVNGKTVEDHMKRDSGSVKQCGIANIALPGVTPVGNDILGSIVQITERRHDGIEKFTLLGMCQGTDLLDTFVSAAGKKCDTAHEEKQDKKKKG